jgi:hypothetical protein
MLRRRALLTVPLLSLIVFTGCMALPTSSDAVPGAMRLFCWRVGILNGGYADAACNLAEAGGPWALLALYPNWELRACLYVGFGGFSANPYCGGAPGGSYEIFWEINFGGGLKTSVSGSKAYVLKSTISSVKTQIKCPTLKTHGPLIEGDLPSMTSYESLEYTGCGVETPANCVAMSSGKSEGTIITSALLEELVENSSTTKVESVFTPQTGKTFLEFVLKNKGSETCTLKNTTVKVEGSTLTMDGPEVDEETDTGADTVKSTLKSEPSSKNYENDNGSVKEAKLQIGKEAVTLEGEAALEVEAETATLKDSAKENKGIEGGKLDIGVEK